MAYASVAEVRDRYDQNEILDFEDRGDVYTWCFPLHLGPFDARNIWKPTEFQHIGSETALYVHIPYCKFICSMCPFTHEPLKKADLDTYVNALLEEIRFYSHHPLSQKNEVSSLYFGGGTASSLSVPMVERIIDEIRARYRLTDDCRITLECHPRTVDKEYLEGARQAGVNRVSFGIQSFKQDMVNSIALHQNVDQSIEIIDTATGVGFDTVAIDIMYHYPDQKCSDLEVELDTAIELGVQGLSMYALDTEVRNLKSKAARQASVREEWEMFYYIHDRLHDEGFVQVAQPDYARPGHENRHITDLWGAPQAASLSFGAGAFSEAFNGHTWSNINSADGYIEAINRGHIPTLVGQAWSWDDVLARYPALGVRCLEVPRKPFKDTFGIDIADLFKFELDVLQQKGYVEVSDDALLITRRGKFFIDNISKSFFNLSNRGKSQLWGQQLKTLLPDKTYPREDAIKLSKEHRQWIS